MKSVKSWLSNDRVCLWVTVIFTAIVYALMVAALISIAGCGTVRPTIVHAKQASWDGNEQNSGLIGIDAEGNRILTPHARDRYNALMDRYGKLFPVPVDRDDGIRATETNTFLLDAAHIYYFRTANRWDKQKLPAWEKP